MTVSEMPPHEFTQSTYGFGQCPYCGVELIGNVVHYCDVDSRNQARSVAARIPAQESGVMTDDAELAAIRAADSVAADMWFKGPASFTALAARHRRTLLRFLDEARETLFSAQQALLKEGMERDEARGELAALREVERQWDMHGLVDTVKANEALRAERDAAIQAGGDVAARLAKADAEIERLKRFRPEVQFKPDGAWLIFESDSGKSAVINLNIMASRHDSGIIKGAIVHWVKERAALAPPPSETP